MPASAPAVGGSHVMKPITERPNELTNEIDVANGEGIVRLLRTCDAQMFSGYGSYASLLDAEVEAAVDSVTAIAAEIVASPHDSCVVIAGAGTSGRLACLAALSFNEVLCSHGGAPCFHGLIAGGERALLRAQEGAEDNAEAAVADLQRVELEGSPFRKKPYRRVLYVGISCGLSATYVAAQLQYAMAQPHYAAVLLGFNPVPLARRVRVAGFGNTFHEIATELQRRANENGPRGQRHVVLTPVVGPEAICGSTRLKGGTATKILLEAIFGRAVAKVLQLPLLGRAPGGSPLVVEPPGSDSSADKIRSRPPMGAADEREPSLGSYRGVVEAYEGVYRAVYNCSAAIGGVVEMAGSSLRDGGSLFYVGAGSLGLIGIIDASEQAPTFGALPHHVRAFALGGWPLHGAGLSPRAAQAPPAVAGGPPSVDAASGSPTRAFVNRGGGESPAGAEQEGADRGSRGSWGLSQEGVGSGAEAGAGAAPAPEQALRELRAGLGLLRSTGLPSGQKRGGAAEATLGEGEGGRHGDLAEADGGVEGARGGGRREDSVAWETEALFESVTTRCFVRKVLPEARPCDTVVVLLGGSQGPPLPDDLASAILKKKRSGGGIRLAVVSITIGPHDRLLCTYFESAEGTRRRSKNNPGLDMHAADEDKTNTGVALRLVQAADRRIGVTLPAVAAAPLIPGARFFSEVAGKLVLNAVSTGAHVLIGKVYRSLMIDLRISNQKLYHRASAIVSSVMGVSTAAADDAILKAVYGREGEEGDDWRPAVGSRPAAEHVARAVRMERVVPLACLLATGNFSRTEALHQLQACGHLRRLIEATKAVG